MSGVGTPLSPGPAGRRHIRPPARHYPRTTYLRIFASSVCGLRGRQRHVAVLDDHLLAFLAVHQLHELGDERVERLAGRLVHVDVEEPPQRVLAALHVGVGAVREGPLVRLRQRDGPDARRLVADAAVADAEPILGDALHDRRGPRLLLDRVLVVAVLQRVLLEEAVGAARRVAAVEADRPVRPVAREPELAPGLDVFLVAALAGLREHRLDLRQRHLLDRVVLVHVDRERVVGRSSARSACSRTWPRTGRSPSPRISRDIGPNCAVPAMSAGGRRGRALAFDLDLDVRIHLPERLGPERHHVVHRVGADAAQAARHAADLLVGRADWRSTLMAWAPTSTVPRRRTPSALAATNSYSFHCSFLIPSTLQVAFPVGLTGQSAHPRCYVHRSELPLERISPLLNSVLRQAGLAIRRSSGAGRSASRRCC